MVISPIRLLFSDENLGSGNNGRSPAAAGLLEGRDGLWEVGTMRIIGRRGGIVKVRRRQGNSVFSPTR